MSALAALLLIVPLAALQPYHSTPVPQAASSSAQSSMTAHATAPTSGSSATGASDTPFSRQIGMFDSARATLGAKLGTMDTARARMTSAAAALGSTSTASPSASSSSSTSQYDDICDRFQYGNSSQSSVHMHSDDDGGGRATIRYLDFDQNHCRAARIDGKILTSDNEDHIISVLPQGSGRAYFRERTGQIDRELTFIDGRGGATPGPITYRVNGVERPYDDEGRRWFAELLPRVLAEASINVEQRVKHWRSQGGTDVALRQIDDLQSAGAKRAHYVALLDSQLSAPELDRLVEQAGKDIPSSGDLRAVLSKAAQQSNRGKVPTSTLEAAIGAIPSSGDLTAVLLAFSQTDDREQLLAVARTALKIPSSGDRSRLLIDVAPRYLGRDNDALLTAYFKVAGGIPSSGDLSRVLVNAVPYAVKSSKIALSIMTTASVIASSGDRADVFVALADVGAVRSQLLRNEYLTLAKEIPASSDIRRALEAITRH